MLKGRTPLADDDFDITDLAAWCKIVKLLLLLVNVGQEAAASIVISVCTCHHKP